VEKCRVESRQLRVERQVLYGKQTVPMPGLLSDHCRFRGRELTSLLDEILIVSALIVMVAFWGIVETLIARQERRRRFLREYPDLDHLHPRSSIWSVPRPPKGKSS
jgi:hypothetical protein